MKPVFSTLDDIKATINSAWQECRGKKMQCLYINNPGRNQLSKDIHLYIEENFAEDCKYHHEQAEESEITTPYQPFLEIISTFFDGMKEYEIETIIQESGVYYFQIPVFKSYFTKGITSRPEELLVSRFDTGNELNYERKKLLKSIISLLSHIASIKPLIIQIDNLHFAKTSTFSLLKYITRKKPATSIMLIITCDNEFRFASEEKIKDWIIFQNEMEKYLDFLEYPPAYIPGEQRLSGGFFYDYAKSAEQIIKENLRKENNLLNIIHLAKNSFDLLALRDCKEYLHHINNYILNNNINIPDDQRIQLLRLLGDIHSLLGEDDAALIHYDNLLNFTQEIYNRHEIADAYRKIGHIHFKKNNLITAERFQKQSIKLAESLDDEVLILKSYLERLLIVNQQYYPARYWRGIFNQLISLAEKLNMENTISFLFNIWRTDVMSTEKAIEYCDKSIEISLRYNNNLRLARSYQYKGIHYTRIGDYKKALDFFTKSEQLSLRLDDPVNCITIYNSRGYLHLLLEEYNKAHFYFHKAFDLLKQTREYNEIIATLLNLALVCFLTHENETACEYLENINTLMKVLKKRNLPYHSRFGIFTLTALAYLKAGHILKTNEYYFRIQKMSFIASGVEEIYFNLLQALIYKEENLPGESEQHFQKALNISLKNTNYSVLRILRPRLYLEYGIMLKEEGKKRQAEDVLNAGINLCNEFNFPYHKKLLSGALHKKNYQPSVFNLKIQPIDYTPILEAAGRDIQLHSLHHRINEIGFLNFLQNIIARNEEPENLIREAMDHVSNNFFFQLNRLYLKNDQEWELKYSSGRKKLGNTAVNNLIDFLSSYTTNKLFKNVNSINRIKKMKTGIRSLLYLPLLKEGKLFGIILFATQRQELIPNENDLRILSLGCSQISTTLQSMEKENELKQAYSIIKEDLSLARRIQKKILPEINQSILSLIFTIKYLPMSEVGGDLYDIFKLNDNTIRIFVADAAGHGVQASLVTMLIKGEYEKLKSTSSSPAELLAALNNQFISAYRSLAVFFTCVIVDIKPDEEILTYCSAGHPSQYLISENTVVAMPSTGKLLGVLENVAYRDKHLSFLKGNKLFLLTDGVFEEFDKDGNEFGEDALMDLIQTKKDLPARQTVDELLKSVQHFLGIQPYNDDITLIGIE